jgi:tRNA threonylcarbamoyladenosine biosynthesis protein TsaE
MVKLKTVTLAEIPALAKAISAKLKGGEIFALTGTLGSGKTTFAKALGKQLKIKQKITSPTFVLLQAFPFKLKNKPALLYHLDLYRTRNFNEVKALGLLEIWGKPNTVTIIEWADKINKHLPKKTNFIQFGL